MTHYWDKLRITLGYGLVVSLALALIAGCHVHLLTVEAPCVGPRPLDDTIAATTSRPAAGPTISDQDAALNIADQMLEDGGHTD